MSHDHLTNPLGGSATSSVQPNLKLTELEEKLRLISLVQTRKIETSEDKAAVQKIDAVKEALRLVKSGDKSTAAKILGNSKRQLEIDIARIKEGVKKQKFNENQLGSSHPTDMTRSCTNQDTRPSLPPTKFDRFWVLDYLNRIKHDQITGNQSKEDLLLDTGRLICTSPVKVWGSRGQSQSLTVSPLCTREILVLMSYMYLLERKVIDDYSESQRQKTKSKKTVMKTLDVDKNPYDLSMYQGLKEIPQMSINDLHSLQCPSKSGLLDRFFDFDYSCGTCGLRFNKRDDLATHHDVHFLKNAMLQRRLSQGSTRKEYRGWFEGTSSWMDVEINYNDLVNSSFSYTGAGMDSHSIFTKSISILDNQDVATSPKNDIRIGEESKEERSEFTKEDHDVLFSAPLKTCNITCAHCGLPLEVATFVSTNENGTTEFPVYRDSIAIRFGETSPIVFNWTADKICDDHPDTEYDHFRAEQGMDYPIREHIFYIHNGCWESNRESIISPEYQIEMLSF